MSYDRQIDQVCPHIVIDEALFVSPEDRMVVRPLKPIASSNSVRVRLNGEVDVPSYGIHLPAQSSGTKVGAFNITSGVNDQLVLSVNQGADQTITIPAAKAITAEQLVPRLNLAARGLLFSAVQGRIAFRTSAEGSAASVFVRATSTLAGTLGIVSNREYRGRTAAPGWTLVADPVTLLDRPTRLIIFDDPLRDYNPFVEISYNTIQQECRRCGGLGVENDWRYGSTGEVVQVRDEALLIQEVQKVVYTVRGTNPFHNWYGADIIEVIGKKLNGLVQNMIVADIYQAFRRWQAIKQIQEEKVGQFVSDEEYPFKLLNVNLEQSTQDPTVIFVNIAIQNRSSRSINLSRGLKLPGPLDLLGTTPQAGLLRQSLSNHTLVG